MLVQPSDPRLLWLLVRTKPKQEAAAVRALASRGIEAYFPRLLEPRSHARAPRGPVPLFPSYVFAHVVAAEQRAAAHYCPGVAGLVRFGDALGAVEDEFVADLRRREGERGFLVVGEVRRPREPGSRVRVVRGPLAGYEGIVARYLPSRDRVRLLLAMVGGTRTAEVAARDLD
ncbi:MAG TPA: transcription termination/antitermination NusG family protein [Thermoanaerobaculaceae bacterium]|nr:transcription termination/antitermination NusG family protein [Thermoanaerobaculaceae bacterium]